MILALAVADEACDAFLTSDPVMVRSERLLAIAEEHGTAIVPFGERQTVRRRRKRYTGRRG